MKIPKRKQILLYKSNHLEYLVYVLGILKHTGMDKKTALVKCLAYKLDDSIIIAKDVWRSSLQAELEREWYLNTKHVKGLKVIPITDLPLYIGWGVSGRAFEQVFRGEV